LTSYNHRGPAPYFRRPEDLPVVICGPILRRVTRESVSVFVALKTAAADIRLRLYDTASPGGAAALATSASPCPTVALGRLLHVAVVTLKLSSGQWLLPEHRYGYDLSIDGVPISTDYERFLGKSTVEGGGAITYGTDSLPGFVVPARQAKRLRLLYGSCRKPHGEGHDMLAAVDDRLRHAHDNPGTSPQLLLLGGDQIYADDVSPFLLRCLNDSLPIVLGWREVVPSPHFAAPPGIPVPINLLALFSANELASDGTWLHSPLPDPSIAGISEGFLRDFTDPLRAARIAPPRRGEEVRLNGGLSSGAASAHLVFLGEFMLGNRYAAARSANALTTAKRPHYLAARLIAANFVNDKKAASELAKEIAATYPAFATDPAAAFAKGRYPEELTKSLTKALRAAGLGQQS